MSQTESQRRASDAVAAWLAAHQRNPAWLVGETGADPGTIGDFLSGSRWPKLGTQGKIERALGWPPGTIRQIGNGGEVPEAGDDASVGGPDEDPDEDSLRFRRPEGLSDQEWERIREDARGFIEWQIERAARER